MKVFHKKVLLFLLYFFCATPAWLQEVTISNELNIRTDYAYELLGKIDEEILLFRDRGFEFELEVFDQYLQKIASKQLHFDQRKIRIIGIVPQDTFFQVHYTYKKDNHQILKSKSYNSRGVALDTVLVLKEKKTFIPKSYKFTTSEDKSKSLFFYLDSKNVLKLYVYDNYKKEVLWEDAIDYDDYNLKKDFRKVRLSNDGEVFLLLEKDNSRFKKDKHFAELNHITKDSDNIRATILNLEEFVSIDIELKIDEKNKGVVVVGLYSQRNKQSVEGYFIFNKPWSELPNSEAIKTTTFGKQIMLDVYGKKGEDEKYLKHFTLEDVLLRNDGGVMLVTEMKKEFSRRSSFGNRSSFNNDSFGGQSWIDYENEDMVIVSLNPDGSEHWSKVLYKKQFSQDDGAAYSSFFAFRTPSRLRLLYNDDIKKNSTVSEYVMDPLGNFERNAVLSTDEQKIKLRFRDAIQISSSEILVPSEKSYLLNLVKIAF